MFSALTARHRNVCRPVWALGSLSSQFLGRSLPALPESRSVVYTCGLLFHIRLREASVLTSGDPSGSPLLSGALQCLDSSASQTAVSDGSTRPDCPALLGLHYASLGRESWYNCGVQLICSLLLGRPVLPLVQSLKDVASYSSSIFLVVGGGVAG